MSHTTTRRVLLAATGACLTGGLAWASGTSKKSAPPPPLVIGAALPLSGSLSLVGDECLRGIRLAADAVNAPGGIADKPFTLVPADAVDQSHAPAAVNTLITKNHANVLLGGGVSALSYPISAAAELAQTPYIELNAIADGITTRGFKFLLRICPTTTMIADLAVSTIQSRYQGRKIGLLFNTGATGGAIAGAAIAALNAAKTPILLSIGYPETTTDLYEPVGRLKRAGVEIVLHAAGPDDVLAFFSAMQEQNWRPRGIIGCGDGYLLRETAFALGPAFNGTLVVGAPFYPPLAASIADAYTARFGAPPRSADSLTAYVGAKLVFDTLNTVNGDTSQLLDALRKTDIPAGSLVNGWGAAFDHNGQNTRSFVTLQQWRGQQLIAAK
jgi:branched-chain amino acid transport system substrate-binding protein